MPETLPRHMVHIDMINTQELWYLFWLGLYTAILAEALEMRAQLQEDPNLVADRQTYDVLKDILSQKFYTMRSASSSLDSSLSESLAHFSSLGL